MTPIAWAGGAADGGGGLADGPSAGAGPGTSRWLPILTWAVWIGLVAFVSLHHEAWRDEAETWLMARDAPFGEILHRTAYLGTPVLWFSILAPFAKAGLPFATQALLHGALAAAAVWVLLRHAPFPSVVRSAIAFGYFLSFEYSVVARGYVLVVLGLFLLAARRRDATWVDGLLIALTANATTHGFLLATVVLAVRYRELPRTARIVAGLGLAAVVWQLQPPVDGQMEFFGLLRNAALLPRFAPLAFFPDHDSVPFRLAGAVLAALAVVRLARRPRALALLVLGWGALVAFFSSVHVSGIRHVGLFALWLVYVSWEDAVRGTGPASGPAVAGAFRVAVGASLAVSLVTASRTWKTEVRTRFSEGVVMAAYLKDHGLAHAPIAAHPASHCESVLVHLPRRTFWYPGIRAHGSYMRWDADYARGELLGTRAAAGRVRTAFPRERLPLLLLAGPLPGAEGLGYRLRHATPGRFAPGRFAHPEERFFLYEPLPPPPPYGVRAGARAGGPA